MGEGNTVYNPRKIVIQDFSQFFIVKYLPYMVRKRIRDMQEKKISRRGDLLSRRGELLSRHGELNSLAVATYYLAVATYHLATTTYFLTNETVQFLFLAV